MVARCVRLSARTVDALILSLALPVMLMLIFVYLFGGAIDTGGQYVTYVVPGVILLSVAFASGQTAVSVAQDVRAGIIDRFRAMDIGGPAMLAGHVLASVLRNAFVSAFARSLEGSITLRDVKQNLQDVDPNPREEKKKERKKDGKKDDEPAAKPDPGPPGKNPTGS